jgi:hypothetical protein
MVGTRLAPKPNLSEMRIDFAHKGIRKSRKKSRYLEKKRETVLNNHHNFINSPGGSGTTLVTLVKHCVQRARSRLRESKYSDRCLTEKLPRYRTHPCPQCLLGDQPQSEHRMSGPEGFSQMPQQARGLHTAHPSTPSCHFKSRKV